MRINPVQYKLHPLSFFQLRPGECPVLIGYGNEKCRAFAESAIGYVLNHTSITTVVLNSRWYWFYICKAGEGTSVLNCDTPTGEYAGAFLNALDYTLQIFEKSGRRVVFAHSIPPAAMW